MEHIGKDRGRPDAWACSRTRGHQYMYTLCMHAWVVAGEGQREGDGMQPGTRTYMLRMCGPVELRAIRAR